MMTKDKNNVIRVPAEPQNSLRSRVFIAQDTNDPEMIQARLVVGFSQREECVGTSKQIREFLSELFDRGVISKSDREKARRKLSELNL